MFQFHNVSEFSKTWCDMKSKPKPNIHKDYINTCKGIVRMPLCRLTSHIGPSPYNVICDKAPQKMGSTGQPQHQHFVFVLWHNTNTSYVMLQFLRFAFRLLICLCFMNLRNCLHNCITVFGYAFTFVSTFRSSICPSYVIIVNNNSSLKYLCLSNDDLASRDCKFASIQKETNIGTGYNPSM